MMGSVWRGATHTGPEPVLILVDWLPPIARGVQFPFKTI